MTRPTVSVALLAGGRVDSLARCLSALGEGSLLPNQVVVVNNRDETADEVSELLSRFASSTDIDVVELPRAKGGFAEARNKAVEACTQPLVAILDDDCYADHFWLERHVESLDRHDAVGGIMLPWRRLKVPPDWAPELNWLVGLSTPTCLGPMGGIASYATTSNVSFRRELWERYPFQELGGDLDAPDASSNYRVGREDADWWARLRNGGVSTGWNARAIVWHDIDPKRFSLETSASRAKSDGAARWLRMRDPRDVREAARDVVHAPVRWFADSLNTIATPQQSRRHHIEWTRRQWSLISAAVDDYEGDIQPQHRTAMLAGEVARLGIDLGKAGIRRSIAGLWDALHQRKLPPSMKRPPSRLAVVCYPFLGDAILTMPALEDLRAAFPDTHVTLFIGPAAAPLFETFDAVDTVEVLPAGMSSCSVEDVQAFTRKLRQHSPDAVIVAFHHLAPALPLFLAGAPVVMWDHDNGIRQQTWFDLADVRVPKNPRHHEMVSVMNLFAALGVPTRVRRPRIVPSDKARAKTAAILDHHDLGGGDYAVVHMDIESGSRKHWPWERFGELAEHLIEHHGLKVFFHGHRRGRGPFELLKLPKDAAVSLHGAMDSMDMAALMERARVAIGVDSGPQHVAQAVGCPTLVMFDTWLERRWRPLPPAGGESAPFRSVVASAACRDWAGFELDRMSSNEAYQRLSVQEVVEALESLLADFPADESNAHGSVPANAPRE